MLYHKLLLFLRLKKDKNMSSKTDIQILSKIQTANSGALFFISDFATIAKTVTIRQALQRLVMLGEIERVSGGIYVRTQKDDHIGTVMPDIEDIANAIARRDRAIIAPTFDFALNRLGLSTQAPMNIIFLTDGVARKFKVCDYTIVFKKASKQNVTIIGEIYRLAKTIGKERLSEEEIEKLVHILTKKNLKSLANDLKLAPEWMRGEIKRKVRK